MDITYKPTDTLKLHLLLHTVWMISIFQISFLDHNDAVDFKNKNSIEFLSFTQQCKKKHDFFQ